MVQAKLDPPRATLAENRQVSVQLQLPESLYAEIQAVAETEGCSLEQFLVRLLQEAMVTYGTVDFLYEVMTLPHQQRLAEVEQGNRSPQEILQDLRNLREEIAQEADAK